MKRRRETCMVVVLVGLVGSALAGTYGGGSGTAEEPCRISTVADWQELIAASGDWDKHFVLVNDIDFGGANLTPVAPDTDPTEWYGFQGTAFTGLFDGNGHILGNAIINRPGGDYVGLFGCVEAGGLISNLGVENISVTGRSCVGGLVGNNSAGAITSSYSTGDVSGNGYYVGGLVGYNRGTITACYSTGTVSGGDAVGGLVGRSGTWLWPGGRVTACYSTGAVTGGEDVGGLVGTNWGTITACFWDVQTSGQAASAGGTGLTTAQMQQPATFLGAGWDFVDETANGTCDYWHISPGDYPRLSWQTGAQPVMPEGLGTAEAPYLVRNAGDLGAVWLAPLAYYRLEERVDLSGMTSLTAPVPWFAGHFDGNGHVICNLCIRGGSYLGLFGQVQSGGSISNLGLEGVNVHGAGDYVGGLVGNNSAGAITSSYSTGDVSGNGYYVGGLVGGNGGTVTACYATAKVLGTGRVGGLAGQVEGTVVNSHSTAMVYGSGGEVGGLVGYNDGSIVHCSSASDAWGYEAVGGLVGSNGGTIIDCHSYGQAIGENCIGGLAGRNGIIECWLWDCWIGAGEIHGCSADGTVIGQTDVGGLAGNSVGTISACLSRSDVIGETRVGGLAGCSEAVCAGGPDYYECSWAPIDNCYAEGIVVGREGVGGLVGDNRCYVSNSYSMASVSGHSNVGGLLGFNSIQDTDGCAVRVLKSFWDTTINPDLPGVGSGADPNVIGELTENLQKLETFAQAGWDFTSESANGTADIWRMCGDGADYPRLAWEFSQGGDFDCPDGVALEDIGYLADRWLATTPDTSGAADANSDDKADLADFAVLAEYWMKEQ